MIYLDSGATTLEKPPEVARAMARAVGTMSSPGRGNYPASRRAEQTAFACREAAAGLFQVPTPDQVVFTSNATHGLNIAIRSLVRPGGRVAISGYEHNAVTRVLHSIPGVEMIVADAPLFAPEKILEGFHRALRRGVDAVVCNHVSNVFGCVQPVEAIAQLCRRYNTPLIVDASQSAGILPVTLSDWGAAFVAMPGHKGLYGPQGMGLLLCGGEASPLLFGGTGSASRMQTMPPDLPDRLEAGTHNMPGIAGLLEGLRFVARMGTENIADHEIRLTRRAARGLAALPGNGQRADRRGAGPKADRRALGAALCALGPPHCRDPGNGDRAPEPVGFQHAPAHRHFSAGAYRYSARKRKQWGPVLIMDGFWDVYFDITKKIG